MTCNESIESFLEKLREFGEEFEGGKTNFPEKLREFGEEFCALHCIESFEELQQKKDEFFRYIAERAGE